MEIEAKALPHDLSFLRKSKKGAIMATPNASPNTRTIENVFNTLWIRHLSGRLRQCYLEQTGMGGSLAPGLSFGEVTPFVRLFNKFSRTKVPVFPPRAQIDFTSD